MKSLKQIRATLIEAVAQDTEAHFVAPTEAQSSISADRGSNEQAHEYKCSNCDSTDVAMIGGEMLCNKCGQDAEKIDEEGGDREIGPGTQLRTNKGVWCVVDEIDAADSEYAWCTDEDGEEIHVNLNTADVVRTGPPHHDREDQDTSMYQEGMDPQKKRKNLEVSMDYLHKKIRDEKNFYKKDEYKDDLRKLRDMYDKLDEAHMADKSVDDYIKDYRASTDPRFEGKSKAERIKMAVSDFNKANAEKTEGAIAECMDGGHQVEEVSMTRLELDEIADMADDLFHVLPNFDEVPAWVQHKIAAMHAGLHSIYDYYRLKGIERDQCSKGGLEVITIATPQNPVVQPAPVSPAPMD